MHRQDMRSVKKRHRPNQTSERPTKPGNALPVFSFLPYRLLFYVKYNLDVGNVGLKENITELWGEG